MLDLERGVDGVDEEDAASIYHCTACDRAPFRRQ